MLAEVGRVRAEQARLDRSAAALRQQRLTVQALAAVLRAWAARFGVADDRSAAGLVPLLDALRGAEKPLAAAGAGLGKLADSLEAELDRLTPLLHKPAERRSVLAVLLHWDKGVLPSVVAVLLLVYNVSLYWLITGVASLRDEEERSGVSPAWDDYRPLGRLHRWVVTPVYYVSLGGFLYNVFDLLTDQVVVLR